MTTKNRYMVRIESAALDGIHTEVRRFEGVEEINRLPAFDVELWTPEVQMARAQRRAFLDEPVAIVFLHDGAEVRRFEGVVTELSERVVTGERGIVFRAHIGPRVWALSQNRATHLFMDHTVPNVIASKLKAGGFVEGEDFVFALTETYEVRDVITQYDESDFAFISRLAEHLGIAFWLEERGGREVLVISDAQGTFGSVSREDPVPHGPTHLDRAVLEVHRTLRKVPRAAVAKDYNYRAPRLEIHATEALKEDAVLGEWVEYGGHSRTPEATQRQAKIRAEEIAMDHYAISGTANEPTLRAGARFRLQDELDTDEELLILKLEHHLEVGRDSASEGGTFMTFTAIPASVRYRPRRTTPKPKIAGFVHAKIDGAVKGDYAEIDEWGRYRVSFGFDRSGRTNLEASRPMRMLQPHAGERYGMHFPLRPGAEVLVAFVEGDPDRPVIVGGIPNPGKPSPVESSNYTENVLRSASKNEMVMEDYHGRERVRVHSPHHDTTLQLGSWQEPEVGALLKTNAHISFVARESIDSIMHRSASLMNKSATLVASNAVFLVGLDSVANQALGLLNDHTAVARSASAIAEDLRLLGARRPSITPSRDDDAPPPFAPPTATDDGGTFSGVGDVLSAEAHRVAEKRSQDMINRADENARQSESRTRWQPLKPVVAPSLILGSSSHTSVFAKETALLHADRVTCVSSDDTARIVGGYKVELQSPDQVEIAGRRAVHVTSSKLVDVRGRQLSLYANEDREDFDASLVPEISVALFGGREVRIKSETAAVKACAAKDFVIHSHEKNVQIVAKQGIVASAGSIQGSAGTITFKSNGDVDIQAGSHLTIKAAHIMIEGTSDVTIKGPTITLDGDVTGTKGHTVLGKLVQG